MILGVSDTESPGGIRTAYLDLARQLHPDVAGTEATRAFQELTEAYDVLSDPRRRQDYNNELRHRDHRDAVPVRRHGSEPAVPDPVTILGNADRVGPSFDAIYGAISDHRFFRNFTGIGVPKAARLDDLMVEVVLTADEWRRGCIVPIGASGRQGAIEREEIVRIKIPPMVPPGSVFEMTLQEVGIADVYFKAPRVGGTLPAMTQNADSEGPLKGGWRTRSSSNRRAPDRAGRCRCSPIG